MKAQRGRRGFFVTEVRISAFRYEGIAEPDNWIASIPETREKIPASTFIIKVPLKVGSTERQAIVYALTQAAERFQSKCLPLEQDRPLSNEVLETSAAVEKLWPA